MNEAQLRAGEAGDDGSQGVHVWLVDDVVGNPPALPAPLEIFDELAHGSDEHVGALKKTFTPKRNGFIESP